MFNNEKITVNQQVPVLGDYDVVVIGAGPAGVGAALTAARLGKKVILIERNGFPGGIAAYGCANVLYQVALEGRQVAGGIADEIIRRLGKLNAAWIVPPENDNAAIAYQATFPVADKEPILTKIKFDIDVLTVLLHDMLSEAEVTKLFYSELCTVLADHGKITAVTVNCREGLRAISGKIFIDATGCAQMFHLAGVETISVNSEATMHKSLFFFAGGVTPHDPQVNYQHYKELHRTGRTPKHTWPHMGQCQVTPDSMQIAFGYTNGDDGSSLDMTRMDHEMRKRNLEILDFLRHNMAGYENAHIARSAGQVCVREGRRMVGETILTREMLHSGVSPDDPVISICKIYGSHGQAPPGGFQALANSRESGFYAIPFRSLISRDFSNAMACGKCISVGDHILGTVRMMPTCMITGQAAGAAAALVLDSGNIPVRELPYTKLRKVMQEMNCIFYDDDRQAGESDDAD